MQYLKFTYRFLICEMMISCCSCCVRDQYDTMALLSALCCHSVFPPESQCPDKSFLLREAFSDNVIWGCAEQQLLLLDEHLEKGPCASSASGCFLSHTLVMKCTPGLRNSLGAGANIRRSKFIIWYYNIPHLQNWEQAHLLTQNKTEQLAGRDTARLSFHSPLTARQDVMHPVPRAFSALPISDKRWKQRAAL